MSSEPTNELLVLTLTPDNPVNTTITDPSGTILYTAETLYPRGKDSTYTITHVCGDKGQTLAALEWKDVRSDLVAFGEEGVELDEQGDAAGLKKGKAMKMNKWMKSSLIPFDSSVSFEDEKGRKYKWKGVGTGETMEASPNLSLRIQANSVPSVAQLHASDQSSSPIAQFQKSRPRADPPKPAQLLLTPRAQEIINMIVISFLFLEKSRRARDNSTQMKADILGSPYISLPGGSRLRTQVVHKGGV